MYFGQENCKFYLRMHGGLVNATGVHVIRSHIVYVRVGLILLHQLKVWWKLKYVYISMVCQVF